MTPAMRRARPGRGRGAGGEHLLVADRLAGDAGGGVGDQGQPEHLGAEVARGDRLEHGGHADQVGAGCERSIATSAGVS